MTRAIVPVLGNSQKLDGGSMYGNCPRAVWPKWSPPDEQDRIDLACRAMLVREPGRNLLFETGIGSFFDPQMRARYVARRAPQGGFPGLGPQRGPGPSPLVRAVTGPLDEAELLDVARERRLGRYQPPGGQPRPEHLLARDALAPHDVENGGLPK